MLADAARTYLVRYGVKVGTRALIVTADDSAYAVATALQQAGVAVVAVDMRPQPREAARASRVPVRTGMHVVAHQGRLRIAAATLSNGETVACDALLMCGGWTPSVHLFSQSRGKLRYDERLGAFLPGQSVTNERSAGACNGSFYAWSLSRGRLCRRRSGRAGPPIRRDRLRATVSRATRHRPPPHAARRSSISRMMSRLKDLRMAAREGFRSIEHVKRYTTTGMATDQGKTSNMNALAIVSDILHQPVPAGRAHDISHAVYTGDIRRTSPVPRAARCSIRFAERRSHDWAAARGACSKMSGHGSARGTSPAMAKTCMHAVARECRAVRNAVGIFDATTLGKIEVIGPDAAEFLNRTLYRQLRRTCPGTLPLRRVAERGRVRDG